MGKIHVFLDTDVIISSLLSKTGASFEIVNHPKIKRTISGTVKTEVMAVGKRLKIETQKSEMLLRNIDLVTLGLDKSDLIRNYQQFLFDHYDAHVVAGA